jgi:hypothetical protein
VAFFDPAAAAFVLFLLLGVPTLSWIVLGVLARRTAAGDRRRGPGKAG